MTSTASLPVEDDTRPMRARVSELTSSTAPFLPPRASGSYRPANPRALVIPPAPPISAACAAPAVILGNGAHITADIEDSQGRQRARCGHFLKEQAVRVRLGGNHGGNPGLFVFGQADPEVQTKGLGDLVPKEGAERLPRHAPDHLTDQPAIGEGMIAVAGAGLPKGFLFGQRVDHQVPIRIGPLWQSFAYRRQARPDD